MLPQELRMQRRGGKGLTGMTTKDEDMISHFFLANTHDAILFFTQSGKVFVTRGYEVPEASRVSRGKALVNFLQIGQDEVVTAVVPVPKAFIPIKKNGKTKNNTHVSSRAQDSNAGDRFYLFMTTREGVVKKVSMDEFTNIRRTGVVAIKLKGTDELRWVKSTSGSHEIILVTSDGKAIRFKEKDVRPMGRNAAGVTGIRLRKQSAVVGMEAVVPKVTAQLLIVMENGYGKRTDLRHYKVQKRGGKGVKTAKVTAKTGAIVSAQMTDPEQKEIIVISRKGQVIKTQLESIPVLGRATQGVRIMRLEKDDGVASIVAA
jgi:DNA gyrase subunit A